MHSKQSGIPGLEAEKRQPRLGEIKKGKEIGKVPSSCNYMWTACLDCGKERWVKLMNGKLKSLVCLRCASKKVPHASGEASHSWKGGRRQTSNGYIEVHLRPDDFFYPMADCRGYVREHRLIMAQHLHRRLLPWEVVHHKPPGIKDDNRLENLELLSHGRFHVVDRQFKAYIKSFEKKLAKLLEGQEELKQEIRLLRLQNKLLREKLNASSSLG